MDQATRLRNIIKAKDLNNSHSSGAKHARVLTVTSGKGGVGKSNVAVNLAVWFAKQGKRVIVFDADFGLANVEVMFGAIPKYNLSDVIYRGKSIKDVITPGPEGIGFISGGSGVMGMNNLNQGQIQFLLGNLSELDQLADIIIIDTGAGVSETVLGFVLSSPEVLLVTTPEPSSLTDAYSLLKAVLKNPSFSSATKVKVITNRVKNQEEATAIYQKLNSVVGQFLQGSVDYLGMIPQDPLLEKAVRQQKPVSLLYPDSKSSLAMQMIANTLMNIPVQEGQKRGITHLLQDLLTRRN